MKLYKNLLSFIFLALLVGNCAYTPPSREPVPEQVTTVEDLEPSPAIEPEVERSAVSSEMDIILGAERKATTQGQRILETGRRMTLDEKAIVRGGCWDYANTVYNRAGFTIQRNMRMTIFKTTKSGPYANVALIQPGDFLHYVNHSYGDIEHSAIFVDWVDYESKRALMISYAGENRHEPARYRSYDLSSVYCIIRAARSAGF